MAHGKGLFSALAVSLLLAFAPGTLRAGDFEACQPSPAVKAALDDLPSEAFPDQTGPERRESIARFQALRRRFPEDLFVERRYIHFMWESSELDKLTEDYKGRMARSPDDPRLAYLAGVTLFGRHTPEAIGLFEAALEKAPRSPWPHLELVDIYLSQAFSNKEKAAVHLRSLLDRCPGALDGYVRLKQIDDPELARQSAPKLRRILRTRRDLEAVAAYPALWSLEFMARPTSEYDSLRKQVAADLKRLRSLGLEDKQQWYAALIEGYELLSDQKEVDRLKLERARRCPLPWEVASGVEWTRSHPEPKSEDPPESWQAYYEALLKESDRWLKERPGNLDIWWERETAILYLDVPEAEVERTAEEILKAEEADAGAEGLRDGSLLAVARLLSVKGVRPGRVLELVGKARERMESESREPVYDLANKEQTNAMSYNESARRMLALELEARAHLQLGQIEKARSDLAAYDTALRDLKASSADDDVLRKDYAREEASYWGLVARLAETEGRKADAMVFYQNGLLTRLEAGVTTAHDQKDLLMNDARRLWKELGGTEEGWNGWYVRRANTLATSNGLTMSTADHPLPSFELNDLGGRKWRSADLRGKVVLLNVWASW